MTELRDPAEVFAVEIGWQPALERTDLLTIVLSLLIFSMSSLDVLSLKASPLGSLNMSRYCSWVRSEIALAKLLSVSSLSFVVSLFSF